MSERQIITISDDKLSCEATAILLRMLNFPDTDLSYRRGALSVL